MGAARRLPAIRTSGQGLAFTERLVVVPPSQLKSIRLSTPHTWPQLPVGARGQQRDYLSKPSYLRNSASPISPSPSPPPYSRRRFMAAAPAKTHTTARTANTPNPMYMSRRLSPPSPVESTLNGTRRGPPLCGFREFDGLATTFDRRTIASAPVVRVRGWYSLSPASTSSSLPTAWVLSSRARRLLL
jgi:hypothetical protein